MRFIKYILLKIMLLWMYCVYAGNPASDPHIIGAQQLYGLFPLADSTKLSVNDNTVEEWRISQEGKHLITSIVEAKPETAWLKFVPSSPGHNLDTIVVSATFSDGQDASITIYITSYGNKYQYYGEMVIDQIRNNFFNGQYSLYAESINSNGVHLQPVSYIWPASHLLRAFKTAYALNNDKYLRPLRNYSIALDNYLSTAYGKVGYAAYPGDRERYYDDNGLFAIQFAEIYTLLKDNRMLTRALIAYDFNNNDRDVFWGLPQHENQSGQGMFYSMAVNQTGLGAALLFRISGNPTLLDEARNYYTQMNNPDILLKDRNHHLFHQYTFFQGGSWSYAGTVNGQQMNGSGFRAYQTTHVVQLALQLFQITGNQQFLNEAKQMMDRCIDYWVRSNGSLYENAFWGGNDMIDALIDTYNTTTDTKYLDVARGIIDYLITYGRDDMGYYPSDYDDNFGRWNIDQRGNKPSTILMMGQAAAASGILRVAHAVEHGPVLDVKANRLKDGMNNSLTIYPAIVTPDQRIHILNPENLSGNFKLNVYSIDGKLTHQMDIQVHENQEAIILPGISGKKGIYILNLTSGNGTYSGKIILN